MTAPVLVGEHVLLRPVADRDSRRRLGWHAEVARGYGHVVPSGPMSDIGARIWDGHIKALDPVTSWVVDADASLAGLAFLHSRVVADRRARLALGAFAPSLLGRGLGRGATRPVLAHAFDDMGTAPSRPARARAQREGDRLLPRVRLRRGGPRARELPARGQWRVELA